MRNWKKLLGTCLLFAGTLAVLAGSDITLSLEPARPFAGRSVILTVTANAESVRIRRLPRVDSIRWSGSGSSRSSTMMQMSYSSSSSGSETVLTSQTGVGFTAEKEGRFTIPPFEVLLDGKPAMTPSFTFEVEPKPDFSRSVSGQEKSKRVFAVLRIPGTEGRKSCFVGEELPLDFLIFISRTVPYDVQPLSQPEFRAEKDGASVRFRDYRKKNPRAPNYEGRDAFRQKIGDQEYTVYRFTTRFRPISPGPLKLSAEWTMEFVSGMGFFARHSDPIPVSAPLENSISVEALPPLPADMPPFCGLVGHDWKIQGELHPGRSCVGDPATLKIRLEGSGSTEAFRMSAPELPDFRCYPPEIQRGEDGVCTVSCTLIPLKEGAFEVGTGFSTFDPVSGVYHPFRFRQTMNVKKAETMLPAVSPGRTYVDASRTPEEPPESEAASGASARPKDILYLHRDTSDRVLLPLWRNSICAFLVIMTFAVLFFAAASYRAVREAARRNDPAWLRRKNARQGRRALLRALRSASEEELPGLASRVSDYLNDALDLPLGAPLSEAADRFDKGKSVPFAQALRELSDSAWMPGGKSTLSSRVRTELIRGISRFTILILASAAMFVFPLNGLSAGDASSFSGDAALTAYDSGDFRRALDIYSAELRAGTGQGVSPSLLYNMGNCWYQLGEFPRALICYERAIRLAPRNSDILENLNLTRRKLLLGEKYRIESPADLIVWTRDILRFDEWILAAALGFAFLLIALGIRPRFRHGWRLTAGLGVILLAGALTAAFAQGAALYSGRPAIVIQRNAPVRSLPSERNSTIQSRLKEGREIQVEETRLGWARIRSGGEEGWVRESDILPLWREDMTDLISPEKQP